MTPRRSQRGLTLLELLVGLVLLSLIAVLLASTTQSGLRILERTEGIDRTFEQVTLRLKLRQWLREATAPSLIAGFETGLEGTTDGVWFTTMAPVGFSQSSAALRIGLQQEGRQVLLLVEELDDNGDRLSSQTRLLTSGVDYFAIRYLEEDIDGRLQWRESWSLPERLPLAVSVEMNPGTLPEWPPFKVPLVLGAR